MDYKISMCQTLLTTIIVFLCFCQSLDCEKQSQKRGFLLTAPNVWLSDGIETVCLSLHGITSNGQLNITLKSEHNKEPIVTSIHSITNGKDDCFKIVVPAITMENAKLHIDGIFEGGEEEGYEIKGNTTVTIVAGSPMTFIQTDKPIYKPGQQVKFRILKLDVQMLPIVTPVDRVWIDNPTGVRVAMWTNPATDQGITDLSLQLSDEPPLGNWNIVVQNGLAKEMRQFTVKEYVLPKFSVEIIAPANVLRGQTTIKFKVCAKYSYGQPVMGDLVANVGIIAQSYQRHQQSSKRGEVTVTEKINGCHDIEVKSEQIKNMGQTQSWGNRVQFYAEVKERGTDTVMNATKTAQLRQHPFEVTFNHVSYFKPGLSYYGKATVIFAFGNPAPNETVNIFIQTYNKMGVVVYSGSNNYTSGENGEIQFTVAPQSDDIERFRIKVSLLIKSSAGYGYSHDEMVVMHHPVIYSWYSLSKSFIQIDPIEMHQLSCDTKLPITISSIFASDMQGKRVTLNYQVLSRGELLFQNKVQHLVENTNAENIEATHESEDLLADPLDLRKRRSITINNPLETVQLRMKLNIQPHFSPTSYLLVFYIRPDGEVVSDHKKIELDHCFDNKVEMNFLEPEVLPGASASIELGAQPQSLCAFGVVDQSVYFLSNTGQLDAETVFSKLTNLGKTKKFSAYDLDTMAPCIDKSNSAVSSRMFLTPQMGSPFKDAFESFVESGVSVVSDLTLITRPCRELRPMWYRGIPSIDDPTFVRFNGKRRINGRTQPRTMVTSKCQALESTDRMLDSYPKPEVKTVVVEPIVEIRDFFPETWLWELQKVGETGKATLHRDVPHSITTWTGSAFCTSLNKGVGFSSRTSIRSFQPFFLSYTMPYSVKNGEIVPLKVSMFNYLSECFPVKISIEENPGFEILTTRTNRTCICGHQSYTHVFTIRPTIIGNVNITVHAHSISHTNTSLCEGFTNVGNVVARDAITKSLLVKAEGFPKEVTNTTMFCPSEHFDGIYSNMYTIVLPHNVVDGSARAYVRIVGDIMGPTISGLDKLVRLPTGCGEQNMVLFAPNVFVLHYLTNTKQLTEEIKHKALAHLKTGYQRQLTYKHPKGGYSAFGKSDKEGSMWLTAFVLKSFAQARPFTFIDVDELDNTTNFIKKHQMENGCFESTGRVLSKAMKGGLESGHSSAVQALTAYVAIALLETGVKPSSDVIKNAFFCLEAESYKSLYLLALKTYVAALAGSDELAWKYWRDLEERSITKDGTMHWEMKIGNTISPAISVEITSYALLALITLNEPQSNTKALSIIRWLVKQRTANGGFISTQDTVLALQAISSYAATVPSGSDIDLEVKIETDDLDDTIHVTAENHLVMQTKTLSHFPTVLDVEATGQGCALLEVLLKYNIHETTPPQAFHLETNTDCEQKEVRICTKYQNSDGKSNMAVVEINTPSGHNADHNRLEQLKSDNDLQVKRLEVNDEGTVNLYFDELTSQLKCFNVQMVQTIDVQNIKPSVIEVYDYYQPELSASTYYSFEPSSNCTNTNTTDIVSQYEVVNCSDGQKGCPKNTNTLKTASELTKKTQRITRKVQQNTQGSDGLFEPDFLNREGYPAAPTMNPLFTDRITSRLPDCPACLQEFPPNFLPLLCYGDIAIVAEIRNENTRRMKLLRNAHRSLENFQRINRFANYTIVPVCSCNFLKKGQRLLIVGKLPQPTNVVLDSYNFNRKLYLIRTDKQAMKKLRKLHKQCKQI